MNSLLNTTAHAITKYTRPAGIAHFAPTWPQFHRRCRPLRSSSSSCASGDPGGAGAGTMFEVTQSWMLRLQHVVVPMAAQQISGRTSWSRMLSVRCVAGQQIAVGGEGGGGQKRGWRQCVVRVSRCTGGSVPWSARRRMRVAKGE